MKQYAVFFAGVVPAILLGFSLGYAIVILKPWGGKYRHVMAFVFGLLFTVAILLLVFNAV